jgi:hypothetical protein
MVFIFLFCSIQHCLCLDIHYYIKIILLQYFDALNSFKALCTKWKKNNSNMASCFDALKSSKHFAQNKKRKEKI